jgi:proteasome accessory factor A
VILDVPGWPALQRIPLLDPLRGTSAQVKELVDRSETVEELFTALGLGRPAD